MKAFPEQLTQRNTGIQLELRRVGDTIDQKRLTLSEIYYLYVGLPNRRPTLLRYISKLPNSRMIGAAIYLEHEIPAILLRDACLHPDKEERENAEALWQHLYYDKPLEKGSGEMWELAEILKEYFDEV